MKRSRLKPMSAKKRAQIPHEAEVRQRVCHSQGGCWVSTRGLYGGVCIGDICAGEGCGEKQKGQMLHEFAHKVNLSQGGKTDEENCRYLCTKCHKGGDHHESINLDSQPMWGKG